MSAAAAAAANISRADWRAWMRHLATKAIKGTALAMKSTLVVSGAGQASGIMIDWHVLGLTAIGGFAWAVIESLAENPFPTGDEVPDDS